MDAYSAELDSKLVHTNSQNKHSNVADELKLSPESSSPSLEPRKKRRKTDNTQIEDMKSRPEESELWTEKYQFKSESDIVTNNSQLERLKEWLSTWKRILAKQPSDLKSSKKKGRRGIMESDSEFCDSDYSNSESMSSTRRFYSNGLLLSGPHGSGKTS